MNNTKCRYMKTKKWIFVFACALMTGMATSCDEKPVPSPDDEIPPHITPPEPPVPVDPTFDKGEGVIRLVSYNVGAFSKYTYSIEMIAKMMKELDADVVGMNEVDSVTTRTSREHQVKKLAEKMGGWHYYYGRAMPYQGGAYGNAIVLSPSYKKTGEYRIAIPKGSGSEPRSCAVVKSDKFVYMATHLDVKNEAARLEGARLITEWAKDNYGNSDMPVFLCGDMNCEPSDAPIVQLKKDWQLISVTDNTYPSRGATKCIDFIFVLKNKAQVEAVGSAVPLEFEHGRVTDASDHLPVYADVKIK